VRTRVSGHSVCPFPFSLSPDRGERGLKRRLRKCLHLYEYFSHPQFGFMSARLQTWFPFNVQICLNGREWLATQLRRRGRSDFKRVDNCFTWLGNPERAQRLMDEQLATDVPFKDPRTLAEISPCLVPSRGSPSPRFISALPFPPRNPLRPP
jgi:hypothetical protein